MQKTAAEKNDEVVKQYSGKTAENSKGYMLAFAVLCVLLTGVMLFYYFFGRIGTIEIRAAFLAFVMMLCYFPKSGDRVWKKLADIICMAASLAVGIYLIRNNYEMKMSFFRLSTEAKIMGCLMIVLVLEATRRKIGPVMPAIAIAFLLYAFFGNLIPGKYGTSGYSLDRVVNIVYTGTEGIYGTPTGVMVSTVFLFMLFGSLLQSSGAGRFFIDFSKAALGRVAGGPAKIAVASSMLFGSINGSAVANTVATGSFTIPMMKETGYDSEFSGAVEAASSTGGQLMPPIMGAGAFLLAELTGTPYSKIALISIAPALMYYSAVFLTVHLEAKKRGLKGLPSNELPQLKTVVKNDGICAVPLIILLALILVAGLTVQYSAIISTAAIVALGVIRLKGKKRFSFITEGIVSAVTSVLSVGISCACAGIIVGTVTLTGLGYNFSSSLLGLAGGSLFPALLLLFLLGLILGMGLPTVAAFVLMVSIAGSGMSSLGLPVLTIYMIAFWFSQTSAITPPVCLAAYAAAGIAGAKPFRVGLQAMRLGFPLLVIPFLMAYRSLLFTGPVVDSLLTILTGGIGVIAFCCFFTGYFKIRFKWYHYVLACASGILCFWPDVAADAAGILLFVLLVYICMRDKK